MVPRLAVLRIVIYGLLMTFLSLPARAESVTVAFESYPPYEMYVDGRAEGMNIIILREAFKRIKVDPVFTFMSWRRALLELRESRVDALSSAAMTPERHTFVMYPDEPLCEETLVVVGLRSSNAEIGSLNDLRQYTVGVVRQHSYGEEFDSMRGLNKDYSPDVDAQLNKLLNGRTNVIVGSRLVLKYLSEREGLGDRLKELLVIGKRPLYIVFGRHGGSRLHSLSERLSQVLSEMREDGTLSTICKGYSSRK